MNRKVIIIGGGISDLLLAYLFEKKDKSNVLRHLSGLLGNEALTPSAYSDKYGMTIM